MSCRVTDLECDVSCDLVKILGEILLHGECFLDVEVNYLALLHTNNSVADALCEKLNCVVSHLACYYSVAYCRRAASLNVAEDSCSCFDACLVLESSCDLLGVTNTLGNHDDEVLLTGLLGASFGAASHGPRGCRDFL